jgi:hypothetical protein
VRNCVDRAISPSLHQRVNTLSSRQVRKLMLRGSARCKQTRSNDSAD